MYSSKNSLFTPIYLARKIYKIHGFFLCMLCIFFLSACQKNDSTPSLDEDITIIATESVTPTIKPTFEPTPTVKPSASAVPGEDLTIQSAQTIIETQVDLQKYTISLLTEDLIVDSAHYIAFLANEKSIPLEPVLLVNKKSGLISCLSKDGKISDFHPYSLINGQQLQDSIECDWNGQFYYRDTEGRQIGSLQIRQNDSSSFEFYLHTMDDISSCTVAGIGHILGNNAVFTDEAEHYITFTMNEDTITVYDGDDVFSTSGLTFNGDYIFQDYDNGKDYAIGVDDAIKLLNRLTTMQTKLISPLSDYSLKAKNERVIVDDRICYSIDAFAPMGHSDVLMSRFYVSVDGSTILAYKNINDEPYNIISLR